MAAKIVLNPAHVRVGDWLFRAGQNPLERDTGNIQTHTWQVMAKVKTLVDDRELTFPTSFEPPST